MWKKSNTYWEHRINEGKNKTNKSVPLTLGLNRHAKTTKTGAKCGKQSSNVNTEEF